MVKDPEANTWGIAERLQRLVNDRDGRNINAAARRTGVHQSTLHRICNGEVAEPSLSNLSKIARGYGVTIDWLVEGARARPLLPPGADLGYGDTRADELITWLESPQTRKRLSVRERISAALDEAKNYTAAEFAIISVWCHLKLLEEEERQNGLEPDPHP